jgi:hypothetical protein
VADVCAGAACSNVVVVCHIDIEDQLLHYWPKGAGLPNCFAIAGVRAVLRSNLESRGQHLYTLFPKQIGCRKGLVT